MTITARVLPRLHTKVLLKALRLTRAYNHNFQATLDRIYEMRGLDPLHDSLPPGELDKHHIVDGFLLGGFYPEESTVTVAELKAELAMREHVPNKQESIALRKAKQQRNRQKGRRDR